MTTDPPGAAIFIDGVEVGVSPLEREVTGGTHAVRVERKGYFAEDKSVVFVAGTSESRDFALRPRALAVDLDLKRSRRRRALGWSAVGAGLGLVGGGSYFLAIHHSAPAKRCDDPSDIDINGVCRFRYNTLPQGAVLLALGASVVTTGAALLIGDRMSRKNRDISLSVGPKSLVLRGRF